MVSEEALTAVGEVVVTNPLGLHTRPATLIAKTILSSACSVTLECLSTRQTAQGNSIISMLSLGAPQHTRLRVTVEGPSATKILEEIRALFASSFHE